MLEHILAEPLWLLIWLTWLALVNSASVLFLRERAPRVVLGVWLGNLVTMTLLFEANGYNRLLGLSHVVWWTPLLIHLVRSGALRRSEGAYAHWLMALFLTNGVSLLIDYVDVARYLLGDRG